MTKNQIQEARMKNYFLNAAKEMIRGEGLKSISVRTIAERAGYSYATLYNYYDDLSDLISACISDFIDECIVFTEISTNYDNIWELIKKRTHLFVNYFVQYPATYELIFTEKTEYRKSIHKTLGNPVQIYDKIFIEDFRQLAEEGQNEKEINELFFLFKHSLNSIISFYLINYSPDNYTDMLKNINNLIEILGRK